ncbi:MAG: DsbA family protein [Albidovulum sp.]|nr:DsbA family protein [Albidovulum sp.]MDE0533467.1 DsbA family protein [Albidovulum sp.]
MTNKISLAASLFFLAAAIPAAADFPIESEEERGHLEMEIRNFLLEHPEVLIEAMQVWEQRQRLAQAQAQALAIDHFSNEIFFDEDSWVGGALDGFPTIVEFVDYNCGFCRRAFDDVQNLLAEDGNVRFVVKEFPILGSDSEMASRFAIAVHRLYGDEDYKSVHDAMITSDGPVDIPAIEALIAERGFDIDRLENEMLGERVSGIIATNRELAQILGISGTPGFIIGNSVFQGLQSYEAMVDAIELARALDNS